MASSDEGTFITKLPMVLWVDTKAQRVLYAETTRDAVHFLSVLRAMPVGAAVKLLNTDHTSMVDIVSGKAVLPEESTPLYRCGNEKDSKYVTKVSGTPCPRCDLAMTVPVEFVEPSYAASAGGTVPSVARAAGVRDDDLEVVDPANRGLPGPLLAGDSINIGALKVNIVEIGLVEGLEILKASLMMSKTVLTDVFLEKKPTGMKLPGWWIWCLFGHCCC